MCWLFCHRSRSPVGGAEDGDRDRNRRMDRKTSSKPRWEVTQQKDPVRSDNYTQQEQEITSEVRWGHSTGTGNGQLGQVRTLNRNRRWPVRSGEDTQQEQEMARKVRWGHSTGTGDGQWCRVSTLNRNRRYPVRSGEDTQQEQEMANDVGWGHFITVVTRESCHCTGPRRLLLNL